MSTLFEEALKLPDAERRQFAEGLYESLDSPNNVVYLTPEQEAELTQRLEDYEKNPGGNLTWEEVRDAALAR